MNLLDLISGIQSQFNPAAMGGGLDQPPAIGSDPSSMAPPTDISSRARADAPLDPASIPLPQPRPPEAGPGNIPMDPVLSSAVTNFAPTDAQRVARGMPPIPSGNEGKSGLLSLIAPDLAPSGATRRKFESSLGGGLSTVTGNTAGGAFARGMGGGLTAGGKQEETERTDLLKALDQVMKAKTGGSEQEYKSALSGYYKTLTEQKNAAAAKAAAPVKTATAAKPAATTPEISMKGDGTQATPYAPTSKADYDEIESGSYYIHPSTGQLRLKK